MSFLTQVPQLYSPGMEIYECVARGAGGLGCERPHQALWDPVQGEPWQRLQKHPPTVWQRE